MSSSGEEYQLKSPLKIGKETSICPIGYTLLHKNKKKDRKRKKSSKKSSSKRKMSNPYSKSAFVWEWSFDDDDFQ